MSVKSASQTSDNSEGQTQNTGYDSFREQEKIYYAQVVACHKMNLFSPAKRNLAKKGNCGHPCATYT